MKHKLEKILVALSSGLFIAVAVVMMKLSGEGKTLQSLKADLENKKGLLALKDNEVRQESDNESALEQEEQAAANTQPSTTSASVQSYAPPTQVYRPAAVPAPRASTPAPASVATPAPAPAPAATTRTS